MVHVPDFPYKFMSFSNGCHNLKNFSVAELNPILLQALSPNNSCSKACFWILSWSAFSCNHKDFLRTDLSINFVEYLLTLQIWSLDHIIYDFQNLFLHMFFFFFVSKVKLGNVKIFWTWFMSPSYLIFGHGGWCTLILKLDAWQNN